VLGSSYTVRITVRIFAAYRLIDREVVVTTNSSQTPIKLLTVKEMYLFLQEQMRQQLKAIQVMQHLTTSSRRNIVIIIIISSSSSRTSTITMTTMMTRTMILKRPSLSWRCLSMQPAARRHLPYTTNSLNIESLSSRFSLRD